MNLVPRISGGYFQNVIRQELYIHFLSTFARNMPYIGQSACYIGQEMDV